MTIKRFLIATALGSALTLTGCASGQHIVTADGTCLTCVNNIITGKPMNYNENEHPSSTVGASQSVSSHAAFRVEAAQLVGRGFAYPQRPHGITNFTSAAFNDGLYIGLSSRSTFDTSVALRQAFGILSPADMKSRGMTEAQMNAAIKEKPYSEKRDAYYMGGTFNGAAGPITAAIVLFTGPDAGPNSYVGMKILGFDKKYGDTRTAANALHTRVLTALNYNDVNFNSGF
tara:strand:+ start:37541 stop:38230 length:690 start_codon:yes stop_codon:yes gene_type:complete